MSIRYLIFGLFCGDKFLGRIWRYVSISSFESFGYFLKTQNIFEREGETSLLPAYRGPRTRGCLLSLPPLLQLLKIRGSSKGAMGLCDESRIVPLPDLTRSGRRFPAQLVSDRACRPGRERFPGSGWFLSRKLRGLTEQSLRLLRLEGHHLFSSRTIYEEISETL